MRKFAIVIALMPVLLLGGSGCLSKTKTVKKAPPASLSAADKKKVEAYYIEGVYAYADGDTAKAMAAWKKGLAIDPKHAATRKSMAEAKAKLKAIKQLDK